ncbi:hypothetical protein JVT61DRAFT_10613 [Boletus reticuloceps]|uniref:Uncharacterized protein n=1 Tax=Boletus reticuloceps TaxID=495285 RepID=A0A8I3A621_9AGAM|nr:hypothetical protein JVT61DRAFT_10613 [Boletus reticuloceps]
MASLIAVRELDQHDNLTELLSSELHLSTAHRSQHPHASRLRVKLHLRTGIYSYGLLGWRCIERRVEWMDIPEEEQLDWIDHIVEIMCSMRTKTSFPVIGGISPDGSHIISSS